MMQLFAEPAVHSWIDLDTLLRDYELGLVVVAGGDDDTGSRTVQWVHSSDLADPAPFLTPRTVLLTTGEQFKGTLGIRSAEAYVSRLVAAGTTALGVGVGIRWDRIPPTLVEACERAGLPLIRVPYDTPFIAITRAAARLIDAAVHQQNLARLTSSRSPRSTSIARAEAALATAVVKLLIAGHRSLAEDVAGPSFPRLPRGQVSVIALPAGHQSSGALASVPNGGSPQRLDFASLGDGTAAGLVDGRVLLICEAAKIAAAKKLARGLPGGLSERGSLDDLVELVAQADRALEHARSAALADGDRGDKSGSDRSGSDRSGSDRSGSDRSGSDRSGSDRSGGGSRDQSSGQPHGQTPGFLRGKIVEYRPAMHAGLLQLIGESQDARRRASGFLSPVRTHDQRHGDEIERSLEAWLRHNGQLSPASEELGIHRHTLRARVRTAASLLQRDIDSPDTRAELWTALRISAGTTPPQP